MVCANKGILFSLKKKGNSDTHYNMDETWGHDAKWNKLVMKDKILYDSTYWRFSGHSHRDRKYKSGCQKLGSSRGCSVGDGTQPWSGPWMTHFQIFFTDEALRSAQSLLSTPQMPEFFLIYWGRGWGSVRLNPHAQGLHGSLPASLFHVAPFVLV